MPAPPDSSVVFKKESPRAPGAPPNSTLYQGPAADISAAMAETNRAQIAFDEGIMPHEIAWDGPDAGFWGKAGIKFHDNDKEKIGYFHKKLFPRDIFPNAVIKGVLLPDQKVSLPIGHRPSVADIVRSGRTKAYLFKVDEQDPMELWKFIDKPGIQLSDLGALSSEVIPLALEFAVMSTLGGPQAGVVSTTLRLGAAGVAGETINQQLQTAGGTQAQTGAEQIGEAAERGVGNAVLGAAVTGGARLGSFISARGAPESIIRNTAITEQRLNNVEQLRRSLHERNLNPIEDLSLESLLPDHVVLQKAAAQTRASDTVFQEMKLRQKMDAFSAMNDSLTPDLRHLSGAQIDQLLQNDIAKAQSIRRRRIIDKGGKAEMEQAGIGLQGGIDDALAFAKQNMNKQYDKQAAAARSDRPMFDIGQVKEFVEVLENGVRAQLEEAVGETTTKNVDVPLLRELHKLAKDILKLSDTQTNYQAIQKLRTRSGRLIEQMPWGTNRSVGAAKNMWRLLTEVMRKPTNLGKDSAFVKQTIEANGTAKAYYDYVSHKPLQEIIRNEKPISAFKHGFTPENFTSDIMRLLQLQPSKKVDVFRDGVRQAILTDPRGPRAAVNVWQRENKTVFHGFLFKDAAKKKELFEAVEAVERNLSSNMPKIAGDVSFGVNSIDDLLNTRTINAREMDDMITALGGVNSDSHKLLRAGVFQRMVGRVVVIDPKGVPVVSPEQLTKELFVLKRKGLWDSKLLSQDDKVVLEGLESYVNLINTGKMDAGTSLEIASAIANLKHPATFMAGAHALAVNSVLGMALMSKTFQKAIIGAGRKPFTGRKILYGSLLYDAVNETVEDQSRITLDITGLNPDPFLQQFMDRELTTPTPP